MKKICFITQCSLPVPTTKGGAVETLVEYIIDKNELDPKYEISLISVWDEKAEKESKKYKYTNFEYIMPQRAGFNKVLFQIYRVLKHVNIYIPFSLEFKNAIKLLKNKEYDYYIFEAGPTTQLPALSRIIPKEKLIVHIHWNGMGNKKKDKCFSYLIPVSDYIGKCWKNASGCDNSKILPLYNCAKIENFTKELSYDEKETLRQSLNIPKENVVLIFTGRIVKEKGVKELLEAVEQLSNPAVSLIIIGSANFGAKTNTTYEKEVEEMISNSKKQILFTGYVHQTELYKYYNIADIAVIPSIFQDPAPLVCIEAQATGTALVATRVGGIPEYTTNETALLVEADCNLANSLSDKIEYLIDNKEIRDEMARKAKEHAAKFSTSAYFNDFCAIIERIDGMKMDEGN